MLPTYWFVLELSSGHCRAVDNPNLKGRPCHKRFTASGERYSAPSAAILCHRNDRGAFASGLQPPLRRSWTGTTNEPGRIAGSDNASRSTTSARDAALPRWPPAMSDKVTEATTATRQALADLSGDELFEFAAGSIGAAVYRVQRVNGNPERTKAMFDAWRARQ